MKVKWDPFDKALRRSLLTSAALSVLVAVAAAQDFRGSISGRVVDPTGSAVPGAQVTVTNTATNVPTSATTDDEGRYTTLYLAPGEYRVSAEAKGFKKYVRTAEVRVADKISLDIPLEIGVVSEAVIVTTESPLLETSTATAG